MVRAHVFVSGRVQGVMFREMTKKRADGLRVSGWVKNLKDGRVEAVIEGQKSRVENLVRWMKRGPIWSKVDSLDLEWENLNKEFKGFEIRYEI